MRVLATLDAQRLKSTDMRIELTAADNNTCGVQEVHIECAALSQIEEAVRKHACLQPQAAPALERCGECGGNLTEAELQHAAIFDKRCHMACYGFGLGVRRSLIDGQRSVHFARVIERVIRHVDGSRQSRSIAIDESQSTAALGERQR